MTKSNNRRVRITRTTVLKVDKTFFKIIFAKNQFSVQLSVLLASSQMSCFDTVSWACIWRQQAAIFREKSDKQDTVPYILKTRQHTSW